jgi:DNA replication protein DnaC
MIYDLNSLASRFTSHNDPEPRRLESARFIVEKKFRAGGSNVPYIPGWEKIRNFAAIYALHRYDRQEIENGHEVPHPVSPPRKGLWLFGGCGTGKTHTARVLSAAARIEFYDIRDIDRAYASHGYEIFRNDSPLCKHACIIDDIGSEAGSRFFGNPPVIEYLLEHRYQLWLDRRIPTVFTTNLTNSDDIATVYNHRIRSRVFEMCEHIFFGTNDQRIPPKAESEGKKS